MNWFGKLLSFICIRPIHTFGWDDFWDGHLATQVGRFGHNNWTFAWQPGRLSDKNESLIGSCRVHWAMCYYPNDRWRWIPLYSWAYNDLTILQHSTIAYYVFLFRLNVWIWYAGASIPSTSMALFPILTSPPPFLPPSFANNFWTLYTRFCAIYACCQIIFKAVSQG